MATPQLSPGVLVREVDLTVGRVDNVLDNIGAIAGPFKLGPIDEPTTITTESELLNVFGNPISSDRQYEYWMTASEYLQYGGILSVVRTDGTNLNQANAGVDEQSSSSLKIKNYDDYQENYSTSTGFAYAAKYPGEWGNNLKVCSIDDAADQIIGISTNNLANAGVLIGYGVTITKNNKVVIGVGTTSSFSGHLKGIITGVTTDVTDSNSTFDVKILSRVSTSSTQFNTTLETTASETAGVGTDIIFVESTVGVNTSDTFTAPGLNNLSIVSVGSTQVGLANTIPSAVSSGIAVTFSRLVTIGGTETKIDYSKGSDLASILTSDTVNIITNAGVVTATKAVESVKDWYDDQKLNLDNSTIFWKTIAPKPRTSNYVSSRGGSGDAIHFAIVDDTGEVTGIQGNLLETWSFLSKALDAEADSDSPTKTYYKNYLAINSQWIYAGNNPSSDGDSYHGTSPVATNFSSNFVGVTTGGGLWGQNARNVKFNALGNVTYTLAGGVDYQSGGGHKAELSSLLTSYNLFKNKDEIEVDYLMMGPGCNTELESQAKANLLISIAEERKDCMATISPHRANVVNVTNTTTQTTNLLNFYSPLTSSSYAVFDSGYKYVYDRFNNEFRYVPLNGDIAGLMLRTSIESFPWFSPAGQQRGNINNGVKLAYNPTKAQRDQLYEARINPVINQNGQGIILFGDKTALSYSSAFDRINVRRLFLTVEQALESAANDQLFEINDEDTRENFVNIVIPYLRDIQANRGIEDFTVICDETNNTPDVIDNNEFRADIFISPARSINYVTLTFVATRSGVSFDEVVGTV